MLSDLEQARLVSPDVSDAELVADLMRETLEDLALTPPIDHNIIASYRGVIRIEQVDIPWSGQIAPTDAGLVISLRASHSWGRRRFSAFHEIVHTYLPGFHLQPQYRCEPGIIPAGVWSDPAVEVLCDQGAAELLLPREAFRGDMAGNSVNLQLVEDLAARYEASLAATAARACALSPHRTLFLTLEPSTKPTLPHGEPKLRVKSCTGGNAWRFVPRYKSASEGGVFYRALDGEIIEETVDLDELTTPGLGRVHVSARLYPYTDDKGVQHMRVLALITQGGFHGG